VIKVQASQEIEKPVREVFDFLMDFENTPKWQSGVIESKLATPGPLREGSKFNEVVRLGPWRMNATCEITRVIGTERMAFRTTSSGPIEYSGEFVLTGYERGTKLNVSLSMALKGLWRLLEPVFAGEIQKETADEMRKLRQALETTGGLEARPATA
jgi:uncharacterized membrane protein